MRVRSNQPPMEEGDLTAMIDMTFQLIAFFMVLINFAQTEANDNVVLPNSQLVKPPDAPLEYPIVMHVASDGQIFIGGDDYTPETLRIGLRRELAVITAEGKTAADANVIIRAHKDTPTGKVQDIIRIAQEQQLVNFALRAKEDRK